MHEPGGLFCKTGNLWNNRQIARTGKKTMRAESEASPTAGKKQVGAGAAHPWARPRTVVDRVGGICAVGKPTRPVALEMGPTWGGAASGRARPWLCEEDGGGGWKNSGGIWDSSDMGRRREWEDPVPGHRIRPEVDEDGEGQHGSEHRNDGGHEIWRTPCGGATRLRGPAEHGETELCERNK